MSMIMYTPLQAAAFLGCSLATIYRHIRSGHLTGHGSPVRIEHSQLVDVAMRDSEALALTVDVPTAAHSLGVERRAVYRLLRSGRLCRHPARSRHVRVTRASLDRECIERDPSRAA
jgi:excisionase family DNA binding protein